MKFCPECGSKLPIGTAKFCSNCGTGLWATISETGIAEGAAAIKRPTTNNTTEHTPSKQQPPSQSSSLVDELEDKDDINGEFQNQTIHSLGIKLEEVVERILQSKGYSTEIKTKLIGNSSATNEIDILAKRQISNDNNVLAVECKNYREARLVGIKEIRDFHGKIQDLSPQINDALFVTNTTFTSEADTYAKHNHITLWNGEKLKNDFYLMNIGRLGSALHDIVLDFSLPILMGFEEAIRIDLVNPGAATIARASLVLYPFYVFDYIVDTKKRSFLRGRHTFRQEGTQIIDALTAEPLYKMEEKDIDLKNRVYSTFFSKSCTRTKHSEELLSDMEKNQIIQDLQKIKPHSKYTIHQTGEYAVIKLESKVPMDATRRMVKEEVVEENKARYNDVKIIDKASSCIYVPKWVINIGAQNTIYIREILAASSTILTDEIAYCPKDLYAKIRSSQKQTYAICERCGGAYCSRHIYHINDSYYCKEHNR